MAMTRRSIRWFSMVVTLAFLAVIAIMLSPYGKRLRHPDRVEGKMAHAKQIANKPYQDRITSIQRFLMEIGRNRFSISWNPTAPRGFQGIDTVEVASRDDSMIVLSLDESGTPLAGTWFSSERVTVVDNVMKTVVSVDPFDTIPSEAEHPCVPFARRLLIGLEVFRALNTELGTEHKTEIKGTRASAFLLQLYADRSSVAVLPPTESVRLERSSVSGGKEVIGVFFHGETVLEASAQSERQELVKEHLDKFGWLSESRPLVPRPKMAAVIDHLIRAGLPIKDNVTVGVQLRKGGGYTRLIEPLRHSLSLDEINMEDCFQVVGQLRVNLAVTGPASMAPDLIVRDDSLIVAKHVTNAATDSVVLNLRGQDWSLCYMMTLHSDDRAFFTQKQEVLGTIEAVERQKWEKKFTFALEDYLESLLAYKH